MEKEWTFSFTLTVLSGKGGNIIRINNNGKDCCNVGTRIPAVLLMGKRLRICTALGTDGNACWNSGGDMPLNKEMNVKIEQRKNEAEKYIYTITIDGEFKFFKENTSPRQFKDATMYSALNKDKNSIAYVKLKGVQFKNLGTSTYTQRQLSITVRLRLRPSYNGY